MKNPFFLLTIGLSLAIISLLAYQAGQHSAGNQQIAPGETNPILKVYRTLSPQAQALYFKQSDHLTKPVPERLVELDEKTIGCFGPKEVLAMPDSDTNLGGQCCGALTSFEAYELQLRAIERFVNENGGKELIPEDPYDVPVDQAKLLTQFDNDILLSSKQQETFDEAITMSHHGGPCCCKCWKWHVMSGLAKKLIVDAGWSAHQIAELWDISSSCGHSEDTNLHQHYDSPQKNHDGHG
jgi:hypothetical protein